MYYIKFIDNTCGTEMKFREYAKANAQMLF